MGLAIEVGALAYLIQHDPEGAEWVREGIASASAVLVDNGLPAFSEPETVVRVERRGCASFPYSFLHHLRRAFAYHRSGQTPPDGDMLPEHDAVIADESTMFESHLLCHSDAEGYYLPIDFPEPIFDDAVPGGMLGSSQGLLRELIEVAPAIAIPLTDGRPSPATEDELAAIVDEGRWWRARLVWFALYQAARISVQQQTAIVFT